MRRVRPGFTLIEMMVVVAIIAILGGLLISVSSRPVGANARNVSEQLVSTINFAKLRASATRRVHLVQVLPQQVAVSQSTTVGLAPSGTWSLVQNVSLPTGVIINDAQAGAVASALGSTIAPNTSLNYSLEIRPDGQAIASTFFVTDSKDEWRVIVYHVTGGTYARQGW